MAQIFASERGNRAAPKFDSSNTNGRTEKGGALAALQARADSSVPTSRLLQLQSTDTAPVQRAFEDEEAIQGKAIQRMEEEEALQGKAIQRVEDEEPIQGKAVQAATTANNSAKAVSESGMPVALSDGIKQLSGVDVSDVKVHRDSSKPKQLNAHAYAHGNDIHMATGQDKHLGHEAWHIVQQRQGRVEPTTDVAGMPINDDPSLEAEADVMGAKASQMMGK